MIKNLTLLFCLVAAFTFAQTTTIPNSFKLINNEHPEKEAFYIASITKANMESYRLQGKEVTLHFENGFDCVFFSAKTLFVEGKITNPNDYKTAFAEKFVLPTFNIVDSGFLVAFYQNINKKSK